MVDAGNPTFCGLPYRVRERISTGMTEAAPYLDIAQRLIAIRKAFSDLGQRAWAAKHGFAVTQYNNWETGVRRIPVEAAERLCDLYGLSLDFVYRGKRNGLPENVLKSL